MGRENLGSYLMQRPSHGVIFWDFDGTLAHSPSWTDTLCATMARFDCAVSREIAAKLTHKCFSWQRPGESYPEATGEAWWRTLFGHFESFYKVYGIPPKTWPEVHRTFRESITNPERYTA